MNMHLQIRKYMLEKHILSKILSIKINGAIYLRGRIRRLLMIGAGNSNITLCADSIANVPEQFYILFPEKHPWFCKIYQKDDPRYLTHKNVFIDYDEKDCFVTYAGELPDDVGLSFDNGRNLFCIELGFPYSPNELLTQDKYGDMMKDKIMRNFSKKADKAYRNYSRSVENTILKVLPLFDVSDIIFEYL